MIALGIVAWLGAVLLCIGGLSFLMMFQDVAPSQNSYWWPYLIPAGLVLLVIAGIGAIVQVLA